MLSQTSGFYGSNRESIYYFDEELQTPILEKDKQMRTKSISDDFSAMGLAKDSVYSGQEGSTSYFSFFEQGIDEFTSEFGEFGDLNRATSMRTQTNLYRHSYFDDDEDLDNNIPIEMHELQQGKQTNAITESISHSFQAIDDNQNIVYSFQQQKPLEPIPPFSINNIIERPSQIYDKPIEVEEGQFSFNHSEGVDLMKETNLESESLKCNVSNDEHQQSEEQDNPADLLLALPSTGFNYFQYFNQNQQKQLINTEINQSSLETRTAKEVQPFNHYNNSDHIVDINQLDQNLLVESQPIASDNSNNDFIRRESKKKNKTKQIQSKTVKRMNSELHICSIKQEEQEDDHLIQPRIASLTEDSFLDQVDVPHFQVTNPIFYGKAAQCKEETLKEIDDMKQCNKKNVVKNIMNAFKNFVLDTEQKNTEMIKQRIVDLYNNQPRDMKSDLNHDDDNLHHLNEEGFSNEEGVHSNMNNEEEDSLQEILKKFKRYINSKNFNHYSIRLLIIHPNYGPILRYFLEGPVYEWVSSSKVNDHSSHFIMINYLMLCFSDIKFIEELKRHEKKKARFQ